MTRLRSSKGFAARGGVWVAVQVILMLAVIMLALMFPGPWQGRSMLVSGVLLLTVGGYFGIAGVVGLGKNLTPFPQPREDAVLVQHGIYARVRHPLYTSVMLMTPGWALFCQSIVAFGVALTLIPFLYAKAKREEFSLCNTFPGYADYMRRVPRFIPRWRARVDFVCYF